MALKGPGKPLTSSPHGGPAGKTLKSSPYGKLPEKSKKKPKKNAAGVKDSETTGNAPSEGVALKEVFGILADENGRVTSAKLRGFVKELDLDFSEEEIREMIAVVDPSGKGEISYNNLVGIVRDFSHEFPNVQLTPEELSKELTDDSMATESSITEAETEQPGTSAQDEDENSTDEKTETKPEEHFSRPTSSKARIAANAKRIMEEIDDRMSVIKEDDEPDEGEESAEAEGSETEKENEHETEGGEEDNAERKLVNDDDKETDTEDNKSLNCRAEAATADFSEEGKDVVEDESPNDKTNDDKSEENDPEVDRLSKLPSRASIVKEHRLDSGISTAVGRMSETAKETENGRQSRKCSTNETSNKSRRDSVKSERGSNRRSNSKERSNSKSRKPDKRRASGPRRKSMSSDDPEFYSTMGCSLKLSQIRTRQRLLYIMWRAVYDQAIRKMQQEQTKQQNQKRKKLRNVKPNPSVNAV